MCGCGGGRGGGGSGGVVFAGIVGSRRIQSF